MSWENVIKVERDQRFPNIEEKPIRTTTIGDEPTIGDFQEMGIVESDFEKIQDSFFQDLEGLLPDDLKFDSMPERVDEIEGVFDEILNLELLTYKKIQPNKKIEYLTDLKNKIVNDLYFDIRKPKPYPSGQLLILRERPNIQETLYRPDPRDPEGLATVPEQQAAIISDRFADEAEEFRNETVSKISRILTPFFEDTSIEPVEDDSVPRQEPQAVTGAKPFNFKNVHGDLSRMFSNSIKIDNVGNPVITSLAIKKFEEIIQKEMAKVTGEDSKTPSVSKLPSNTTGKFKNVNRSDKVKFSSVDYFFNKLAQEKQNKTEIDKLFREDIVGLDMSMYRVLVKLYLVNYKNTAVSNLPAILGKKSKPIIETTKTPNITFTFGGKEYDYSSESAKQIQQEYLDEQEYFIVDALTAGVEELLAEEEKQRERIENEELQVKNKIKQMREQINQEKDDEKKKELTKELEYFIRESERTKKQRTKQLKELDSFGYALTGKPLDISSVSSRGNIESLVRESLSTPETEAAKKLKEASNKRVKRFQEVLDQIEEKKNTSELAGNLAEALSGMGANVTLSSDGGKNKTIQEGDKISRKEMADLLQDTIEELNINIIPAFGEQEQEMASRIRGTKLPKRARITEPTARIEPRVLSREQEKQMQQDIKDEANPKTKKKLIEELRLRQRQNRMYEMLRLSGVKFDETRKALDNLLIQLGVTTDTIVKEDSGVILSELNKKDRRLVKTLLQLAHPTEYFNEDVLKLGELITVLKSLGVVNKNKGLKKRILKYEDENLMVVKRAVKLRREYEKLYKSIREVIYPKTGDDNE